MRKSVFSGDFQLLCASAPGLSLVLTPELRADGEIEFIIHRVEDVTVEAARAEHEQIAETLRNRAEQTEAEVYLRAQEVAEVNRSSYGRIRRSENCMSA